MNNFTHAESVFSLNIFTPSRNMLSRNLELSHCWDLTSRMNHVESPLNSTNLEFIEEDTLMILDKGGFNLFSVQGVALSISVNYKNTQKETVKDVSSIFKKLDSSEEEAI